MSQVKRQPNMLVVKAGKPLWRPRRHLPRGIVPSVLSSWLFDTTSLTQRLRQACHGHFQVRVMSEAQARPLRDERVTLRMRGYEGAVVRMVYLLCDERPWVFARTVIPLRTLSGPQRRLAYLGNKPLGEMLFADKSMRRSEVEVARLAAGSAVFRMATQALEHKPDEIWGRRSVFYLQDKPLLVSEIFLPDLLENES
ncbi:MAG: chorismate lyase [Gammaproteobacteria bacterium]